MYIKRFLTSRINTLNWTEGVVWRAHSHYVQQMILTSVNIGWLIHCSSNNLNETAIHCSQDKGHPSLLLKLHLALLQIKNTDLLFPTASWNVHVLMSIFHPLCFVLCVWYLIISLWHLYKISCHSRNQRSYFPHILLTLDLEIPRLSLCASMKEPVAMYLSDVRIWESVKEHSFHQHPISDAISFSLLLPSPEKCSAIIG